MPTVLATKIKYRINDRPQNHETKEAEHERPAAHRIAHPIGCPFPKGQLFSGAYSRMTSPGRFPRHIDPPFQDDSGKF
jgi:hypothetical protein